jgi:hypothetical protein
MPQLPNDLTTLATAKSYIFASEDTVQTTDDATITRLITAASSVCRRYTARDLCFSFYNERRNGNGQPTLVLGQKPILNVASLTISGTTIPLAPNSQSYGYLFDDTRIYLLGLPFGNAGPFVYSAGYDLTRAFQNVLIAYAAGWVTPNQTFGDWAAATAYYQFSTLLPLTNNAGGFIYVNMSAQASQQSGASNPVFNQTPGSVTLDGVAPKAASWVNTGLTTPPANWPLDLEQACIELVMLWYKDKERMGVSGSGQGPEHVSYLVSLPLPKRTMLVLDQFKRRFAVY